MKIEKIKCHNYRQYSDHIIKLDEKDLNVFIGVMGTGKSNLLNAINWCLYNDEPFLSREDEETKKTRFNLKLLESAKDGDEEEVRVELVARDDNNCNIRFHRKELYKFYRDNDDIRAISVRNQLEVGVPDQYGNTKFIEDPKEVENYVERFIPKKIRNYFFFDGENLDKYFKKASVDEIKGAIENISQLNLLDDIDVNFRKLFTELCKEAEKYSHNVKEKNDLLAEKEEALKEIQARIKDKKQQIKSAEEIIEDLKNKLFNKPDVRKIQQDIEELQKEVRQKEEKLKEKIKDKEKIIFQSASFIFLYSALIDFNKYIDERKQSREFPATNDKKLIEHILKTNTCICQTKFEKGSKEERSILDILNKIEYSNDILNDLLTLRGAVSDLNEKIDTYNIRKSILDNDISDLEEGIKNADRKIQSNRNTVKNYEQDEVVSWQNDLETQESILGDEKINLGKLLKDEENSEKVIEKLNIAIRKETAREEACNKLTNQLAFIEKARRLTINTKNVILGNIKDKIEKMTNRNFFELMWKKESFKRVVINDNYETRLLDANNLNCLGILSGGEIEVLALSFTLALQLVSGFDAPIIIDRPLAMVSGTPRKNIAEILVKLSREKQIILLLTPDDYKDLCNIFDNDQSKVWNMKLHEREKNITIEVK